MILFRVIVPHHVKCVRNVILWQQKFIASLSSEDDATISQSINASTKQLQFQQFSSLLDTLHHPPPPPHTFTNLTWQNLKIRKIYDYMKSSNNLYPQLLGWDSQSWVLCNGSDPGVTTDQNSRCRLKAVFALLALEPVHFISDSNLQSQKMDETYDCIVLGTGLTECILSGEQ